MSKKIPISSLSAYAADPVRFCRSGGKAYNAEAAKAGTKAHQKLLKSSILPKVVLFTVLAIGAYFWVMGGSV